MALDLNRVGVTEAIVSIESRELYPSDPTPPASPGDLASQGAQDGTSAVSAPPAAEPAPAPAPDPAADLAASPAADRQAALRALRNLEATEARLERNARREAEEARGKLVQELLPVLDNLDRTIRAAQSHRSDPAMLEGVRLVRQQLEGVLRGYGVERIEAVGQRFDPSVHEAIGMLAVHDPQRHGVVVQQAEPGYRLGARLLRPAKVSVGKLASPHEARPVAFWR
jgi:molecular chaperone GrpE (heat shock protein)